MAYAAKQFVLKFGFSDKATKFENIFIILLQERHVLCAQQRTCQKVDEDVSKQMWSSRIMQTLPKCPPQDFIS